MPVVLSGAVSRVASRPPSPTAFTRPKSSTFTKSTVEAQPAGENIGWLDVAVDQPPRVRLLQRRARLAQEVDHPLGWKRAEPLYQRFQVETVQQLHDQEEGSVVGNPEIVEADGVRRPERRGRLRLTAEALHDHPGGGRRAGAEDLRSGST